MILTLTSTLSRASWNSNSRLLGENLQSRTCPNSVVHLSSQNSRFHSIQYLQLSISNYNISRLALQIVRSKVAEILGENRANEFVCFASSFTIVTVDPAEFSTIISPQELHVRDISSVTAHYDPITQSIYISKNLPTPIDRLCIFSHEFVHAALDYFGGNWEGGHLGTVRPLWIREGFPAMLEEEIRTEFEPQFGARLTSVSYPVLRYVILQQCNQMQGTIDQPCTSPTFRQSMFLGIPLISSSR